jgi:hypothetical protein
MYCGGVRYKLQWVVVVVVVVMRYRAPPSRLEDAETKSVIKPRRHNPKMIMTSMNRNKNKRGFQHVSLEWMGSKHRWD